MTIFIAFTGVAVMVYAARILFYKTPPILPQMGHGLGLLPGVLAALETRAEARLYPPNPLPRVPTPEALPEKFVKEAVMSLLTTEPIVIAEDDEWSFPEGPSC